MMKRAFLWVAVLWAVVIGAMSPAAAAPTFNVTLPANADGPVTGRLIVIVSPNQTPEPRQTITFTGSPIFGTDVEGLAPGASAVVDGRADSYPMDLSALPAGTYWAQALLVKYTRVTRADGHTIWVPVPHESGRNFALVIPGNLYSQPVRIEVSPGSDQRVDLALTETIPVPAAQPDTPWIKRVRIRSEILSRFWGTPIYIGAEVLLPRGFADNPDARYPSVYTFGHFGGPFGFNPDPASSTQGAYASSRDAAVRTGYEFAQEWQSADFPRFVAITLNHASPYFVESYALNSANNGPYGDAITRELIPYLEREFRLIQEPWARIVEGASTGGWEALALQVHYPELFGGAWVFNPDPIDFSRYQLVDIYNRDNMFELPVTRYSTRETPFRRTREGHPMWTMRELSRFETVLGSRGRSGYQFGIWQATHGPVGADGYPVPLWDPRTGAINRDVAHYMRDNGYDLSAHVRRNWSRLGPQLAGRIHMFAGEMDDFYLNLAVYQFEDMIRQVGGEDYPIRIEYGRPKKGHNWHHTDWAGVVHEMAAHVKRNAPLGTDHSAWNY